jgi:carbamoyl-phosphate synthase large subunit
MRILIFPVSTGIGLEVYKSLLSIKALELFTAGSDPEAAVKNGIPLQNFTLVPDVGASNLKTELEHIVKNHQIEKIFLCHDQIILDLAEIDSIQDADILKHNTESIKITSFKKITYEKLRSTIQTPRLINLEAEELEFPIFVKPNRGQGSVGSFKIQNRLQLNELIGKNEDLLFMEYIEGPEYTVDCFSDAQHIPFFYAARKRAQITKGLSTLNVEYSDHAIQKIAEKISLKLQLSGPWFFQLKENQANELILLEVGLRIAGSSAIRRLQGINLSYMWLLQSSNHLSLIQNEKFFSYHAKVLTDVARFSKNFTEIYVDFDDTLVINNRINANLCAQLFRWKLLGVRIILISRHRGDLMSEIERLKVGLLFDEVIHLTNQENKADFMKNPHSSLFIDDSFSELQQVARLGVTCLNPSAFESTFRLFNEI